MNDPWRVMCLRQGHQYQSCMKLNGVPLLPPVLSKECRKEMEYYKLLAKEVEKRISKLQAYIADQRGDSGEDATDAVEFSECAQFISIENEPHSALQSPVIEKNPCQYFDQTPSKSLDSEVVIDVNVKFSEKTRRSYRSDQNELPERDHDYANEIQQKEILTDIETSRNRLIHQLMNLDIFKKTNCAEQGASPSLSAKSFTGSLNDLHGEIAKEPQISTLTRQRSYTLLNPSPQLLAHLEIQSLNTGVDVQAISMSESTTNLSPTSKKRKSWDLESAKVKWSSMALELKNNIGIKPNHRPSYIASKTATRNSQMLNRSLQEKSRKVDGFNLFGKLPNTEPLPKTQHITPKTVTKKPGSPVHRTLKSSPSYVIEKEDKPNKENTATVISESEDPAGKVRELYEKLQKQHTMQMASLIEKQKREQQLLQQVFEEQNNLLLKQLKTVCPKASIQVKEAWGEKDNSDGQPVSLSQLLHSIPGNSIPNSPVSKTITETKSCLNKCDSVLKQGRDIINSIKKGPQVTIVKNSNGINNQVANNKKHVTRTCDSSVVRSPKSSTPSHKNTSRRLNYDTSASTDYEQIMTDRTNDTMADLNVTFSSDNEEISTTLSSLKANTLANSPEKRANSPVRRDLSPKRRSTNNTIKSYEEAIDNMKRVRPQNIMSRAPMTHECEAATTIVAYAKGFLVRRLMRTERVQATVQTIKDALLCALQLHQDREGIRGADVDLHRRLIQQITAACYTLHDTFVGSSTSDRCALIAADRSRKQALATRTPNSARTRDIMSQSHSGVFSSRSRPSSGGLMTRSQYGIEAAETISSEPQHRPRFYAGARRPWR